MYRARQPGLARPTPLSGAGASGVPDRSAGRIGNPLARGSAVVLLALVLCAGAAWPAPEPLLEWRFDTAHLSGQTLRPAVGSLAATLTRPARLCPAPPYMDFDGSESLLVRPKGESLDLPAAALSVEVWVAQRETPLWGGLVGCLQDNGTFEKGWVLGNHNDRFSFGLSSTGADDGNGQMTYLSAAEPVPLRRWCHVVGTYDGAALRIYVNGELSAASDAQKGQVLYTPADFVLGAYKDDDEYFCLDGGLSLVRLYAVALTAEQVRERYTATRAPFDSAPLLPPSAQVFEPLLIDGPYTHFGPQGVATVRWETREACPTVLRFTGPGAAARELRTAQPVRSHCVRLPALAPNTIYTYAIRTPEGETPAYTLDTQFDYSPPALPAAARPYPAAAASDRYARAAEQILRESGQRRGYCLDLGCGDGRLAWELARRSGLRVVGVSTDAAAVKRGREALLAAGCYGPRVTLRCLASLRELPFADYTFNLIVSGETLASGRPPLPAAEAFAKLRPLGGQAYLGAPLAARPALEAWLRGAAGADRPPAPAGGAPAPAPRAPRTALREGAGSLWAVLAHDAPLPGAGQWSHAYGDAGQTAASGDHLVYGTAGQNLEVQWFGLPGPNAMVDRLARKQGPLATAGRLFTLGDDRLIAQDAYNGTILWTVELPGLLRNNLPRNTGNACADGRHLFVAMRDHCWRFDAASGERQLSYLVGGLPGTPDTPAGPPDLYWGYVACSGDLLLGSAVRRGNFETEYKGPRWWFDGRTGRDVLNVCSETLFACSIADGRRLWTYRGGLVINPTISLSGQRLYFLESRSAGAREEASRQLGAPLWSEVHLVALDVRTGRVLWSKPFEHPQAPIVVYLVASGERLAVVSSLEGSYRVRTFAADGTPGWQAQDPWKSDNHGHHIQHPVLTAGRLFLEPHVYEWDTGKKLDVPFPGRSKCGTITAAGDLLHYRDYNDEVWDLTSGTQSEFTGLRSGCWIGMVSGDGLLMSPESAGGCSCRWPIYTSLTYRTKDDY